MIIYKSDNSEKSNEYSIEVGRKCDLPLKLFATMKTKQNIRSFLTMLMIVARLKMKTLTSPRLWLIFMTFSQKSRNKPVFFHSIHWNSDYWSQHYRYEKIADIKNYKRGLFVPTRKLWFSNLCKIWCSKRCRHCKDGYTIVQSEECKIVLHYVPKRKYFVSFHNK